MGTAGAYNVDEGEAEMGNIHVLLSQKGLKVAHPLL